MTKAKHTQHNDIDIFLHVLVIISILIEILIDSIKCLISVSSKGSIQEPTKSGTPSSATKLTKTGNTKTQRPSRSTKPHSTTVVQRKVVGTTKQDTQSLPIASSPRSKQSKPSSNTSTSTRSQSSQALASQRRTRTTKSTSPTNTLKSIPKSNHTTADDNRRITPGKGFNNQSA